MAHRTGKKVEKRTHGILRKAGLMVDEPPDLGIVMRLMAKARMEPVRIGDVHFVDSYDSVLAKDKDLVREVTASLKVQGVKMNRFHTNVAFIDLDRNEHTVMPSILKYGMTSPVVVGRIMGEKELYCVSGRNRITEFVLLYGVEAVIPVLMVEFANEQELGRAIDDANNTRTRLPMEKALRAIMDVQIDGKEAFEAGRASFCWAALFASERIGWEKWKFRFGDPRVSEKQVGEAPRQQGIALFAAAFVDFGNDANGMDYLRMQFEVVVDMVNKIHEVYCQISDDLTKKTEELARAIEAQGLEPKCSQEYRRCNTHRKLVSEGLAPYVFAAHPGSAMGRIAAHKLYRGVKSGERVKPPQAMIDGLARQMAFAAANVVCSLMIPGRDVARKQMVVLAKRLYRKSDVPSAVREMMMTRTGKIREHDEQELKHLLRWDKEKRDVEVFLSEVAA